MSGLTCTGLGAAQGGDPLEGVVVGGVAAAAPTCAKAPGQTSRPRPVPAHARCRSRVADNRFALQCAQRVVQCDECHELCVGSGFGTFLASLCGVPAAACKGVGGRWGDVHQAQHVFLLGRAPCESSKKRIEGYVVSKHIIIPFTTKYFSMHQSMNLFIIEVFV